MMALNRSTQAGMALLVSLIFLLLLSVIGLGAMQSATQQEKMAGSVWFANQSLQAAETALRRGELQVQTGWPALWTCKTVATCMPPPGARTRVSPGIELPSGVLWVQVPDGLFGIQHLGSGATPAHLPGVASANLYRITAIGLRGASRTILESVYARYQRAEVDRNEPARQHFRRILWRQIQ